MTDYVVPAGKRILFLDVDGTIIDSYPGIRAGFLHALDTVSAPHPPEDIIRRIPGPPMEVSLANQGLTDTEVATALAAYLRYTRDGGWAHATAYDGMVELVARLKADGFFLATATSKGEEFARKILQRIGVYDHIDFLGAAEEHGPRRAKDKVIAYVLDSVGLRGREDDILMVGDRTHDIHGAAEHGIATVAVTWGYGSAEEWDQAASTATTPAELERVIHDWAHSAC